MAIRAVLVIVPLGLLFILSGLIVNVLQVFGDSSFVISSLYPFIVGVIALSDSG